eukprot:9476400-Pyramimonas_sp.AAC.1
MRRGADGRRQEETHIVKPSGQQRWIGGSSVAKVACVAAGALAPAGAASAAVAAGVAGSRLANARANGGDHGSEGARRATEGWKTYLIQDGEDDKGIGGG